MENLNVGIKKNIFGGWSYTCGEIKSSISHTRKEIPLDLTAIDLSEFTSVSYNPEKPDAIRKSILTYLENMHIRKVGKDHLTQKIDAQFDTFVNNGQFSEPDYIEMLHNALNSHVFVYDTLNTQSREGLMELMQPDELAKYLSTFVKRISTHFAKQSLATNRSEKIIYLNKLSSRFIEITQAKIVLFQTDLLSYKIEYLIALEEAKKQQLSTESVKHAEYDEKIKKLKGELEALEPQAKEAQKILLSTISEYEKVLNERAKANGEVIEKLTKNIDSLNKKIKELKNSNSADELIIKNYTEELMALEILRARITSQTKAFNAAGYFASSAEQTN